MQLSKEYNVTVNNTSCSVMIYWGPTSLTTDRIEVKMFYKSNESLIMTLDMARNDSNVRVVRFVEPSIIFQVGGCQTCLDLSYYVDLINSRERMDWQE